MCLKKALSQLKSEVDKLDIDRLGKVPSGLFNFKSQRYKWNVDKLAPVRTYLSKPNNVVKIGIAKKVKYNDQIKYIEDKTTN